MTSVSSVDRLTIVCLMRPKPDRTDTLRAALLALVPPTRPEAGCLAYELYEEADGSLVLFESWLASAELKGHQQQEAVRKLFGEQLQDLLTEDMGVHYGVPLEPTV